MSTIYTPDGTVEHRARLPRPTPCPACGCKGTHYCTGGQTGASYVGTVVDEELHLTTDELARVREARGCTDNAVDLNRDAQHARELVASTACTCLSQHSDAPLSCTPRCAKRLAAGRLKRLELMEDMVTGRRS